MLVRPWGSQTEDLHELAGPDVGLGGQAELLLTPEAGDVMVEAVASLAGHVDAELRPDVDVAVVPGAGQGRARL